MIFEVRSIGRVESTLTDLETAPRQGDEGRGIQPGDELTVLTWLDRARREVLSVHPRGDPTRPMEGVFSTRSPHRPNPIGLHEVVVRAVEEGRLRVSNLEAVDGTPIIDLKPVLSRDVRNR